MVVQPERRCLPIEVEPISLHRERRPARTSRRARRRRTFRSWVTALVPGAGRWWPSTPGSRPTASAGSGETA